MPLGQRYFSSLRCYERGCGASFKRDQARRWIV